MPIEAPTRQPLARRALQAVVARLRNRFDLMFRGINGQWRHIWLDAKTFDADFYLDHHPDVAAKGQNPFLHYVENGLAENRKARFFDVTWYLTRYPDLRHARLDAFAHYRMYGLQEGRAARFISMSSALERSSRTSYVEWLRDFDTLSKDDRAYLESVSKTLEGPTVSLFVALDAAAESGALEELLASIDDQALAPEDVCIFHPADAAYAGTVREWCAASSSRRAVVTKSSLASAMNSILEETESDYVALLDGSGPGGPGALHPAALYRLRQALNADPDIEIAYGDEDQIEGKRRSRPYFKCSYNYELMLTHNLIGRFSVFKTTLLQMIRGFDPVHEAALSYDLALRAVEDSAPAMIKHVPYILYHGRAAADNVDASRAVVAAHLTRRGVSGEVVPADEAPEYHRVRFALAEKPLVSIVIPTRDRLDILKVCIDSLLGRTTYSSYEIIVVDNGSRDPQTLAYLKEKEEQGCITILHAPIPFNFSTLNNRAVAIAKGEFICLMNNDIEIVTPDWLEEMLSFAQNPEVGCVGARLWYPDGTLQHAGVLVGFHGVAGHMHKHLVKGDTGYASRAILHQSLSAVTAACLLVRKSIYEEVGGLDEAFAVAFNDVDFCLKVRDAGYRNVWTPYAEMIHHESASRGHSTTPEKAQREQGEIDLMKSRWGESLMADPAYSPYLTLVQEDLSFSWPPRVPTLREERLAAARPKTSAHAT